MNAIELFHRDGKSAGVFYCEKCRIVATSKHLADQCCNWVCKTCGKPTGRNYWSICDPCERIEREEKERKRFKDAEKVTSWDGWVYLDGYGRDGFADSVNELIEYIEDEEGAVPEYAWTCDPNHFAVLDIDDILQRIEEDGDAYEDFHASDMNGVDELAKAITAFNEANKDVVSWSPNYKRAILLQPKLVSK